ncbi:MAG TPA: hypothetical protein VGN97_16620 [Mesorhizobium sp.]|jgi:hypothetical protein|nr:hypothetical protein [Mesorhizobium sp.]
MRIARQQAQMGNGASPLARSVEILLRRLLRVSGGICAILAATVLSGLLVLDVWWTADPHAVEAWPAHVSALGAWIFLQMTALALLSAGLSRHLRRRRTL